MISTSYLRTSFILSFILGVYFHSSTAAPIPRGLSRRQESQKCDFNLTFPPGSQPPLEGFAFTGSDQTYRFEEQNDSFALLLTPPTGDTTENATATAEPALLNSTFVFYEQGTVTIDAEFHTVAGVVGGITLMGREFGPEVDLFVTGRDPHQVQTNMFNTVEGVAKDYDSFGSGFDFPDNNNGSSRHTFTIDWNKERIITSVAGNNHIRDQILLRDKNHTGTWPGSAMRVHLGLWDPSDDADTARWAGGPVNWTAIEGQTDANKMVVYSITTTC